jgi:hypothetical protein
MVAPSNPFEAAKLAFMDGVVSHYNNGVLGEIFNAVITSIAYSEKDVRKIIKETFNYIPKYSEYLSVITFALDKCKEKNNWEEAWQLCREQYKKYNWIHCYPNACAEIVALWFGNGDFDKTMNIICMIGYDVDCNAAQIATVLGIINCENTLKDKWTSKIGDELKTYIRGNKEMSIKGLSEKTVELSKLL